MKSYNHKNQKIQPLTAWRRLSVVSVFVLLATVLLVKMLDMQILHSEFFERQGDARQLRTVSISAHRGDIVYVNLFCSCLCLSCSGSPPSDKLRTI